MRKVLIGLLIVVTLGSMLCVGLVFALAFTPLRSEVGRVIDRVAERVNLEVRPWERQRSGELQATPAVPRTDAEPGILVAGVQPGSPADTAGLRRGDIILEVNGQAVNSLPDLMIALRNVNAGDTVRLQVQRGDGTRTLTLTASEAAGQQTPFDRMHGGLLGIIPSIGMGGGFSFDPESMLPVQSGASISEVMDGSPAETAGLQPGERIVAVDGEAVATSSDLVDQVRGRQPGDEVTLSVENTDGERREVRVTLAENPEDAAQAWLGVYLAAGTEGSLENLPNPPFEPGDRNEQPFENPQMPAGIDRGAMLLSVVAGGPADLAGLESGEAILAVDGETLTSAAQLRDMIAARQPGDLVTLEVAGRAGTRDVQVTLGENPEQPGAAYLGIRFAFAEVLPENVPDGPVN